MAAAVALVLAACWRVAPEKRATITVVAADARGEVMPGVAVALDAVGRPGHFDATTDASGSATFADIEAGEWQATGPTFGTEPPRPLKVTVAKDGSETVHLVVNKPGVDTVK